MSLVVRSNISLANFTTLKTGGLAMYFVSVANVSELKEAVSFAEQKKLPLFVLGGGSNILVSDTGFAGLVIKMEMKGVDYSDLDNGLVSLVVGAGEIFDEVIEDSVAKNYWGLENLSYIPGTVGATPVQNVGAYGVEVSDVIESVTVFDVVLKKIIILDKKKCNFNYRDSFFKKEAGRASIIISVKFILSKIAQPKLSYADLCKKFIETSISPVIIREEIISIRKNKFPDWNLVGTAGSFFKNPIISPDEATALLALYPEIPTYNTLTNNVKVSLGFILDKICNLRGYRIGNVRLFENQALVLVADKGATTSEIISFVTVVKNEVYKKTKIKINMEVTTI